MTLRNQLLHLLPETVITRGVFKVGLIVTPTKDLSVERVLFDTGALHASYVSRRIAEKYKKYFKLEPVDGVIMLADNRTAVPVDGSAALTVRFEHDDIFYTETIRFIVFDTHGPDIIIGLPHILMYFLALLHSMLLDASALLLSNTSTAEIESTTADGPAAVATISSISHFDLLPALPVIENIPQYAKDAPMLAPWSRPSNLAPEDLDVPDPCSFSAPLHFMEQTYNESMATYLGLFDEHIDPAFRKATNVENYLRTVAHKVFVPREWKGIRDVEPLDLVFNDAMPARIKPAARPINPRLASAAKAEFDRLSQYFYRPSNSDIASPLVIAPKATAPFIRFCGDYVRINKYIQSGHFPIPRPIHELEKMRTFRYYADIDWTNSFHQVPLSPRTSAMLSIQTPWGQVEPTFMPEGIGPATGILQRIVSDHFSDFEAFSVCIFDNILVGGHTYEELYNNMVKVIDRCIECNIILKMSKTWLGRDYADFFGYIVQHGTISITPKRKQAIMDIPFPKDVASMRRFLGMALYCKSWIPGYSDLTAKLTETLRLSFQWDPATPPDHFQPYIAAFNHFKEQLVAATALFYPDYDLEWIVRSDASTVGASAALFQVAVNPDKSCTLQPISFVSCKFSDAAAKWSTIEQECYALKFGVSELSYYLRGKHFVLETDHDNLRYLESSLVPKIIRWRNYLESFWFTLRHIPGKHNKVADWLSRVHTLLFDQAIFNDL